MIVWLPVVTLCFNQDQIVVFYSTILHLNDNIKDIKNLKLLFSRREMSVMIVFLIIKLPSAIVQKDILWYHVQRSKDKKWNCL